MRSCHRLSGVVAEQALAAAGELAAHRRDIGVLAITSADGLNAGWTAARQDRTDGHPEATSHIEQLLADVPRHALLLTVIDGHPATLSWIGGVRGCAPSRTGSNISGKQAVLAICIAISVWIRPRWSRPLLSSHGLEFYIQRHAIFIDGPICQIFKIIIEAGNIRIIPAAHLKINTHPLLHLRKWLLYADLDG